MGNIAPATKFLKERIERAINAGKIVVTEKKKEDKKKEKKYEKGI